MSEINQRQQRNWSNHKSFAPKRRTIGWPRSYADQQKIKRGWWETIRQYLF
jgi:hypothetical protein